MELIRTAEPGACVWEKIMFTSVWILMNENLLSGLVYVPSSGIGAICVWLCGCITSWISNLIVTDTGYTMQSMGIDLVDVKRWFLSAHLILFVWCYGISNWYTGMDTVESVVKLVGTDGTIRSHRLFHESDFTIRVLRSRKLCFMLCVRGTGCDLCSELIRRYWSVH